MEQFRTLDDIRAYLATLEKWFARPIVAGEHPTLHVNKFGSDEVVCGIQRDDYLFSACGRWILPSHEHGLSFSAHWQHLKGIYRMKSKRNPGKDISVFWVLETADVPAGLKFIADPRDRRQQHYLLCAIQRMHVEQLREKLIWLADRMAVIRQANMAL